jgi:hypothetical protein
MHGGAGAVLEATAECTPAPLPVDGARVSATVSILASSAAGLRVKAWEGGSGPTRILVEEQAWAGVEYRPGDLLTHPVTVVAVARDSMYTSRRHMYRR